MNSSARPRRVNRAVGSHARYFFLDSTHLLPFGLSVVFGIVVGQLAHLNLFWTVLWVAGPFATWLIVAGQKPRQFLAKFEQVPRWTRGRVLHTDPFHKRKLGRIRK